MIKYAIKVGNDNGNSEHDIIIDNVLITQPNVFARVREIPNLDDVNIESAIKTIENNLIVTINSVSVAPSVYYIGEYARRSRERIVDIKVGAENSKLNSEVPVVNTLGQIAGYAVKKAYNENGEVPSDITVDVDMTTALPVTQYSKKNANEFAEKFTRDKHMVTVNAGTKRINVTIEFSFVKVLPESVPTIFRLQKLKSDDSVTKDILGGFETKYGLSSLDGSFFKSKKVLHVAIGEGTTEYPLTEDIAFNPQFIEGSNNGVGHAIKDALTPFKNEFKLRTFTRQDFSHQLKNNDEKYHVDALDYAKPYLESEAAQILDIAKDEAEKANNNIDLIMVHGGGSILMREYLLEELYSFGESTRIKVLYIPEPHCVTLEAEGLYDFTDSPIFAKLKEKSKK